MHNTLFGLYCADKIAATDNCLAENIIRMPDMHLLLLKLLLLLIHYCYYYCYSAFMRGEKPRVQDVVVVVFNNARAPLCMLYMCTGYIPCVPGIFQLLPNDISLNFDETKEKYT